jgi:hypothetical protein
MEITTVGLDITKRVFQQPPELRLVGFGNAVDVGGDLITWVRRIGAPHRG